MKRFFLSTLLCNLLIVHAFCREKKLNIDPVFQEMDKWCWIACGEMVFKYFDIPCVNPADNYQCGIVGGMGGICAMDCSACNIGSGTANGIVNMLRQYPPIARRLKGHCRGAIYCTNISHSLSKEKIIAEIDRDRPILAGINPSGIAHYGTSEHATLIIGYETTDNGLTVIINDPLPYSIVAPGLPNPYLSVGAEELTGGQYKIDYNMLLLRFKWNSSLYNMH